MPARILVTGASGFVGGHLLPALAAAFPAAAIQASNADIRDRQAIGAEIAQHQPDCCIHLAAIAAIPEAQADPDAAWTVNLMGTLNLARALLAASPGCTLIFASTADAYGASFARGVPLAEDAPLSPMNTYGATKAAADLALGAMAGDGLRAIRLRLFNQAGAGQSADFVLAAFARQIARIEAGLQPPILHVGDLRSRRDFLDVRDACRAYVACVARAETIASGTVLNIASGASRVVGDILAEMMALAGLDCEIHTDPKRLRKLEIPVAEGNPACARSLLGWGPEIPWSVTLADILAYWRDRTRSGLSS
jgi:GDP-4-dehydro-6-deoxy-D-mannose reductase